MDTNKGNEVISEVMKKVDLKNDNLTSRDKEYISKMAENHKLKVAKFIHAKAFRRNTVMGVGLAAVALGVYGYSMYAVSQESFLDDFEDPYKPKS